MYKSGLFRKNKNIILQQLLWLDVLLNVETTRFHAKDQTTSRRPDYISKIGLYPEDQTTPRTPDFIHKTAGLEHGNVVALK